MKNEKYSSKPVPSTGYQVPPQLSLTQLRYYPQQRLSGCDRPSQWVLEIISEATTSIQRLGFKQVRKLIPICGIFFPTKVGTFFPLLQNDFDKAI